MFAFAKRHYWRIVILSKAKDLARPVSRKNLRSAQDERRTIRRRRQILPDKLGYRPSSSLTAVASSTNSSPVALSMAWSYSLSCKPSTIE